VAHQESQVSQAARVPWDQQVLRDRPARKDPWDNVETKAMMANQEVKALQAHMDFQGRCQVTGNSVFGKISTTERILD